MRITGVVKGDWVDVVSAGRRRPHPVEWVGEDFIRVNGQKFSRSTGYLLDLLAASQANLPRILPLSGDAWT